MDNPSPLRCLKTLLTDALCDYIITSINDFANLQVQKNTPAQKRSRYATWVPITKHEFLKFLAVLTNMGIGKRVAVRDYFSSTPNQFTPWYRQMFDRERFEVIYHTMLHFGEPDATGKSKIEPFMNRLIDSYNNAFTSYQEVSIDEMIIGWKGRWKYKQYNASKPHKYHIKSFGLVDSATGYVLNLLTYYGAETSYDPDLNVDSYGSNSVKIMDTLLKPIGSGYHIFADRWYITMNLLDYLISKKQYFKGTFQANRVGFPDEFRSKQLKLNVTVKGKQKPAVIHSYNFSMNGCDRADQMVGYYGLQTRKSKKWWKKIFYWILEVTCSNA